MRGMIALPEHRFPGLVGLKRLASKEAREGGGFHHCANCGRRGMVGVHGGLELRGHPALLRLTLMTTTKIRQMLSRYLEEQGFRVSLAESGSAMWKSLARERADLVLLDLV